MKPLTDDEIAEALHDLPGWRVVGDELTAAYTVDRDKVPPFYTAVAAAEDEADHHARVTVLYGTVAFAVNTHSLGGAITSKDTALARRITDLAAEYGAVPGG
ncbi:4a-hydroxytetrahydrobiopterin dehydratase [Streptomyces sp. NPDC059506]|uniref:4a-hydroxytetrahydrobiopterin dehydratase n=1 Tax=Streptomyces TaxID=1883 RepID=UPI0031D0A0C5